MDYSQIIAEAMNQAQANPALQMQAPALTTGAPLVPEQALQEIMRKALQEKFAPTSEDRNAAMGRIGTALMQPRMPGESVAGNVGKAMQGGQDFLQQAEQRQREQTMAQAALANQIATADQQRRTAEMNMKIMQVKFPVEFAVLQQQLREAQAKGDVALIDSIKAKIMMANGADLLVKDIQARLGKTQAETAKLQAEAERVPAQAAEDRAKAGYWGAMENYINAGKPNANAGKGVKQVLNVKPLDDGRTSTTYMVDGKVYHEIMTPGAPDMATALQIAKRQLKVEKPSTFGFGGASDADVQARAKELMQPKIVTLDETGAPVSAGSAAKGVGVPGPATDVSAGTVGEATTLAKSRMGKGEIIRVSAPTATEGAQFVRDAQGNVVPANKAAATTQAATPPAETRTPSEEDVANAVEKGKQQERAYKNPETPAAPPPPKVTVDDVRQLLAKSKHNANELLILEAYKDSAELTPVERAKVKAALKRGGGLK